MDDLKPTTTRTFTIKLFGYPDDTIAVSEPGLGGFREAAWDAYKSKHLRDADGQRIPVPAGFKPEIEEVK